MSIHGANCRCPKFPPNLPPGEQPTFQQQQEYRIKDATAYRYDPETGHLQVLEGHGDAVGLAIQAMVDVRSRVQDQAFRHAIIAELERAGYTVIPPKGA